MCLTCHLILGWNWLSMGSWMGSVTCTPYLQSIMYSWVDFKYWHLTNYNLQVIVVNVLATPGLPHSTVSVIDVKLIPDQVRYGKRLISIHFYWSIPYKNSVDIFTKLLANNFYLVYKEINTKYIITLINSI